MSVLRSALARISLSGKRRPTLHNNRVYYVLLPCIWISGTPSPSELDLFAWWRHQLETFSALLALCAGKSPLPVNSPHKGQWRGALMFSLICVWVNGCHNREAGDLRRHRAHYDVNVMGRIFAYVSPVSVVLYCRNWTRPDSTRHSWGWMLD